MKMLKNYRYILKLIILLLAMISVNFIITGFTTNLNKEYMLVYTVEDSDTLWSIANKYSKNEKDKNSLISRIKYTNDIGNNIYPGDKLIIPIKI